MSEAKTLPRMQQRYADEIRAKLQGEFGYANPMQVPKLEKIVINMGVGEAAGDQKKLDAAVAELTLIAGQKPVKTLAKKAIAGFKIREGLAIGCKVTLRKARMYEFLDRLVTIALPAGARLPRDPEREGVRRPRQLRHGRQGTDHLPGDRIRQGDGHPRDGHHLRDHGQDERRSQSLAQGVRRSLRCVRIQSENYCGTPQRVPRSKADGQDISREPQRQAGMHGGPRQEQAGRAEGAVMDRSAPVEERFEATLKLAQLPRNGAAVRVRLRCALTGRPRGNYRKFKLSRNMLRALASSGQLPGMVKASW